MFKLADHPILQNPDAGLKNLACNLPGWQSNQSAAEAFFTAASACLDAAWGPFLRYYNLPFSPPNLHFPTGSSFQTECGTIQVGIATAAYYGRLLLREQPVCAVPRPADRPLRQQPRRLPGVVRPRVGTVPVMVFPARHAGRGLGGMGTVCDDTGRCDFTIDG